MSITIHSLTLIKRAVFFWKSLRKEEGNGDTEAGWIEEVKEAMEDVVPEVPTDGWNLNVKHVTKMIRNRKKNWSAPGPDRIANFWLKKATTLRKEIATCFQATAQLKDLQFPLWFSEGKTTLIPKPGEFRSDNQRPITSLNNMYRWYTSCLYVSSVVQGTTAVERLTIYLSIGWFVRMLREKSEISAWHGLMWLRRMILLIMVGYLKCSPYTGCPHGLLRWWRSLLTAGMLELLPKRPNAKRSLLQYVLRKDCPKVMRSVLCCSYCAWIQSHGRYGQLRDTGYLSLYQPPIHRRHEVVCCFWNESRQSQRMEWKVPVWSGTTRRVQWYSWRGDKSSKEVEIWR